MRRGDGEGGDKKGRWRWGDRERDGERQRWGDGEMGMEKEEMGMEK